ncbi:ABC transporter ATP-binding protein [Sinomonas sp.]|uniref:ABC transporter ATP-binding protein n=1 Tax=Sinomonas sp. TaxID=1914986 RepID=UPI003F8068B3
MTADAAAPVLSADIKSFAYDDGDAPVLHGVRLGLRAGSLTAVLGASGSGKSTLAKVLAGWAVAPGHARFAGTLHLAAGDGSEARLEFAGSDADPRLHLGAWGARVAYVPQRPSDLLTGAASGAGEELAFSLEQQGVPREEMKARVRSTARSVGLEGLLGRRPAGLSGGEQRRLALGAAIITRPDVVLLDEPTASLDAEGEEALARVIDELRASGTAVVLFAAAAHSLALQATHCLLLEAGTVAAEGAPADVLGSRAFERSGVLRTDDGNCPAALPAVAGRDTASSGSPAAEMDGVTFSYRTGKRVDGQEGLVLGDVSFTVWSGEVLALTGPNGAGKSTLLRHLAGLLRPMSGTVRIDGRDINQTPAGAIAETVGTLFQDPRDQLFERSALREVGFGLHRLGLAKRDWRDSALAALDAVGLATQADRHPYEFSASEQRLLALATALARAPKVLLLDEPTVGLDRRGLTRLEAVVRSAAEGGAAVVLSTHALAWARCHAHRMVGLSGGHLRELRVG